MDGDGGQPGYRPPPPFAPPALRPAPLNEWQVLGGTTYGPAFAPAYPPSYPPPYPPQPGAPAPAGWLPPVAPPVPSPQPAAGHRTGSTVRRRRTVAVVSTVTVALVAVVAALLVGANGSHPAHTLSLPQSAGGYVKLTTISGSRLTTILGSGGTFGSIPDDDIAHAKVGLYGHSAQSAPTLLFIGFAASSSPTIGSELHREPANQVTADVLDGAGAGSAALTEDAGPLGGSLRCSAVRVDGLDASVGVWADADTLGLVILFDPMASPTAAQTGGVTRAFRAGAEH